MPRGRATRPESAERRNERGSACSRAAIDCRPCVPPYATMLTNSMAARFVSPREHSRLSCPISRRECCSPAQAQRSCPGLSRSAPSAQFPKAFAAPSVLLSKRPLSGAFGRQVSAPHATPLWDPEFDVKFIFRRRSQPSLRSASPLTASVDQRRQCYAKIASRQQEKLACRRAAYRHASGNGPSKGLRDHATSRPCACPRFAPRGRRATRRGSPSIAKGLGANPRVAIVALEAGHLLDVEAR